MEQSPVKQDKKFSRRSFKSAKSATLPAGAVLTHESGEGFFSKIRRSFKIRKKGKFVLLHSHDDTEVPGLARLSQSNDSLKRAEAENRESRGVFKGNVAPQESLQENKNVGLVSSESQKCSTGASDSSPPTEESASEKATGLISDTAQVQSQAEQAAVAVPEDTTDISLEDNNNDKFFDDFDPDYETLDNIRRKLQDRNNSDQNSPVNQVDSSHAGAEHSEMVQGKPTEGSSRKAQDRGELSMDAIQFVNVNTREVVSSVSSTGSRGSLESHSFVSAFEDDLYANAKILKRKQLRRASEQPRVEVNIQPKSDSSFASSQKHSESDCQQRDSPQTACPPPLPARNYSEKDMITTVDKTPFSKDLDCGVVVENGTQKSVVTVSDCSDQRHDRTPVKIMEDADARIKRNTPNSNGKDSKLFRQDSAFIELGPILILNSNDHSCQGSNCCNELSHTQLKFPCAQGPQTVFTSADSSCDDVTEKCCDKLELHTSQEHKMFEEIEDDLMFIDEDQVQDSNCHVNTLGMMDCARGVGPTEVPSTVGRSDQFYISSEGSNKADTMTGDRDASPAVRSATPEVAQGMTRSCTCKSQNSEQHPAKRESKCQDLKDNSRRSGSPQSSCTTEKALSHPAHRHSLSSSQKPNAPSPSPASTPSPVSHKATSRAVCDRQGSRNQDDDARPQVRPRTSRLKQHVLQSSGSAHSVGEIPPPLPALRGTAGRKVVSEELPKTRTKDSDQESCKNRRHSSAVDASRAHNDFLTSMKQLKECGWYWGPLSCEEAVDKLKEKCDGSFLVRDSASDKYLLAISFKYNDHVHHTRIEFHKGLFSFFEHPDEHSKAHICQFIEQTMEHSRKGNYIYFQRSPTSRNNPLSIQLLYPVSRFQRVPSLQHICRFLILCRVRRDHIYKLPLPEKVKGYLSEKQYYVEMLTEDP